MKSCLTNDTRVVTPIMKQLHANDAVVTEIDGLLLPDEADALRKIASDNGMNSSTVVGSDGSRELDSRRTSKSAFLEKNQNRFVSCIESRIATVCGMPETHLEPLQVTDYTHKQEYKAHYDFFDRKGEAERTTTLFAYLEDKECHTKQCGGATAFYKLKRHDGSPLRVYPKKGNAVMWSNRTEDGGVNRATLHGGEVLTCPDAHKVGLNAWFRDHPWK